jgi:PKD repeat protein
MNYFWDFGDGTTSTLVNPIKAYYAAGTYNVKLVITSDAGCKDSTTQTVTVSVGSLSSLFNISSASSQCLAGNSFAFSNSSSTGTGVTYSWDFGSGATPATYSGLTPPSVTYSTVGTKTITLTVNAPGPVTTFSTQTIYVVGNPHSSFTYSNTNNNYTFTSTSTNGANLNWSFGDGSNANGTVANHTYSAAGTYSVRLIATNANISDTSYQTIVVAAPPAAPVAAFNVSSASSQCFSTNSFTFNNTSAGVGNTYRWSFPNAVPDSSLSANPGAVVFNSYGYYNVTLTVTNSAGTSSTTQQVVVGPKPTSSFSYSTDSVYKHTFFNGSYIAQGTIASYNWKLDGVSFSTAQNPSTQILSSGSHTIKLFVTSNLGCVDSSSQTINVGSSGPAAGSPVASFAITSATSQCQAGNSFTVNNTSTGTGNSYQWYFPNAVPSTDTTSIPGAVSFNNYGTYTITLVVTNANGSSTTTQNVTVGLKPTSSYSYSNTASLYTFFNGSYIAQDSITAYNWKLDGVTFSNAKNPSSQTLTGGAHTVTLIVTSNVGCVDSSSQTVTATAKPTAAFTVTSSSSQCLSGNSFTFSNTTSGSNVSYIWNFGDGSGSGSATPTKSYTAAGTYTIKLYATNSGGTDSTTQTVVVTAGTTAGFGYSVAGNTVTFSDSSTNAVSYAWDFGDGFTSSLANPARAYTTLGSYTVKLITTSSNGCKDSVSQNITVGTLPTAAFTITSATTQCSNNNSFTFTNQSTTGVGVTYLWSFGDTTATTYVPFAKTYTYSGTIPVTLTVTNALGSVSTTQNVVVLPGAKASFATYSNTNSGGSYTFVSTSTIPVGTMTYAWNLGNGTTSTLVNPTVTYATPGTYTVKLVVNGGTACADSTTGTVTFCPTVTAGFNVTSPTSQCVSGNSFTFANTSTNNAGIPASSMVYTWSFGDSTFSSLQTPLAHTYAVWGDYDVKLLVTLTSGSCVVKDSITKLKIDTAQPMPVASYRLILDNFYVPTALLSDTTKRCWHPGYDFSYQSSSTLSRGVMDYFWHFGTSALYFRDGDSSHYINPRIVFDTAGIYPVQLMVVSDKGCKDSVTRIVHLSDPRSRFNFTIDSTTNVYASPVVTVTDASYDYGGYLVGWNWNFGSNASPASSGSQTPSSFTYTCGGAKNVVLTVTSNVGCTADTTRSFVIRIKPQAAFTISAPNYTPNIYAQPTYTYNNGTTVNDACPSMTYAWNFGDGYTGTGTTPTHIYKGSGTYTTTMVATNGNGGKKDTTTQTVTVAIRPRAAFSTTVNAPTSAPTVSYTNTSSSTDTAAPAASLNYAWTFGDGSTSSARFPSAHTYVNGGTYTIKLVVTNPISGLVDSVSHNVVVKYKPQAAFSSNVDYAGDIYSNPTVTFTDASTSNDGAPTYTYSWNFGDPASGASNTSTLQNPTHTYTSGGTFSATLTVTNTNGGLTDVVSHNVVIVITPKAVLSVHIDTVSVPVPMSIGNADYKHYTLTALSNLANPSTVVTGSIAHTEIKIDTVYIPSSATNQYADVFDADAEFGIQLDTVPNYLFNITLTVTSNLGVTDVTTATLGAIESGFTAYRGLNPNAPLPTVTLPSIGSTPKPVAPTAPIAAARKGLLIYPNPASEMITVGVDVTTKTSSVNVMLYNSNGKLVQSQKNSVDNVNATRVNVPMNITNLSSGIYNIIVLDNKGVILGMGQCVKSRN